LAVGRNSKRALTNRCNAHPHWLDPAHKRLDEAVVTAYGWKSDLSDEEILEKLLAFGALRFVRECYANLERARQANKAG
jgi:hypothetical protein